MVSKVWEAFKRFNVFSLGFLAGFVCGGAFFATNMILGLLGAGVMP